MSSTPSPFLDYALAKRQERANLIGSQKNLKHKEMILEMLKNDKNFEYEKCSNAIKSEKIRLKMKEYKKNLFREMSWSESGECSNELKELKNWIYEKRIDLLFHFWKCNMTHQNKMKSWLWRVMELSVNNQILITEEWVEIKWIWIFGHASSHNRVLKEVFWWDIIQSKTEFNDLLMINKGQLDQKIKNDNGKLLWDYTLVPKKILKWRIFQWINNNFEWISRDADRLDILWLINPDLFWKLFLDPEKVVDENVIFLRSTFRSTFFTYLHDYYTASLFLMLRNPSRTNES